MLRVPVTALALGELTLDEAASRYVARVHRSAVGDELVLFDPERGSEARARVLAIDREGVRCQVLSFGTAVLRPRRAITLLQGIGKGDKFDQIVRDATELGATHVIAVACERSVVRLAERAEQRVLRWRRVASEAARQCQRADAPRISGPAGLSEALKLLATPDDALRLCLWEEATAPIATALSGLSATQGLALLVGPEGGLSPAEVETAQAAGFVAVSLGPFILRTETVPTAVLGGVLLLHG